MILNECNHGKHGKTNKNINFTESRKEFHVIRKRLYWKELCDSVVARREIL